MYVQCSGGWAVRVPAAVLFPNWLRWGGRWRNWFGWWGGWPAPVCVPDGLAVRVPAAVLFPNSFSQTGYAGRAVSVTSLGGWPELGVRGCPVRRDAVLSPHAVTFERGQNVCPESARTRCGARHTGGSNVPDWRNEHSTMP